MTLWLRSRRVKWLVLVLFVVAGLTRVSGDWAVVLPLIYGEGGHSFLATFIPVIWAAMLTDSMTGRTRSVEARPARRLCRLDAILYLSAVTGAAVAFCLLDPYAGNHLARMGPALVLSGIACVVGLLRGPAAGMFTACGVLLGTSVYGSDAPGGGFVRVLEPDGYAVWSLACGAALTAHTCLILLTDRAAQSCG